MPWGRAKKGGALLVAGILPVMIGLSAPFSIGGRPATHQAATPQASPATSVTPTPSPTPSQEPASPATDSPQQAQQPPAAASTTPPAPRFLVMIDPAHGGEDRGAALGGSLLEKEVTLAMARRLRAELQERGISARLLRDGDITLGLEQRAETANEQHAAVYIALHAGRPGEGVRVYTPALTSPSEPLAGKFLLWENAQANSLPRSDLLAQRIAVELEKKNLSVTKLATPLRPLNNIIAPAVAVELAPDPEKIPAIMAAKYQTSVAAAIATGITQLRSQWETKP